MLLIRFARGQPLLRGYLALVVVSAAAAAVAWNGVVPAPVFPPTVIGIGLFSSLPYLLDRWLSPRLSGLAATLVFPLAATSIEFATVSTNPLGSFGATAYTQYPNLALIQVVSVTGIYGLGFLVSWLGPVAQDALGSGRRAALVFAGVVAVIWAAGSARLLLTPLSDDTVRVAAITASSVDMPQAMATRAQDEAEFRRQVGESRERYFEATRREAAAGARIVAWPELAGLGLEDDEAQLVEGARALAREQQIWLALPLATLYRDPERPFENKLLLIDPRGEVAFEHFKFGGQAIEGFRPGDRVLRTVSTPYGVVSAVICWDMDFPGVMRQAGRNGTDILLAPSYEWPAIDPLHAQMAVFRAIENGVSLLHPADRGRLLATDPLGRVLAEVEHQAGEALLVAELPVRGVATLHPQIGDAVAWLCVVGFLALAGFALQSSRRRT